MGIINGKWGFLPITALFFINFNSIWNFNSPFSMRYHLFTVFKYIFTTVLFILLGVPVTILFSIVGGVLCTASLFVDLNNTFLNNTLGKLTEMQNAYFLHKSIKSVSDKMNSW